MPEAERKPARVQMKGPNDSSSVLPTIVDTRDQGVDPITFTLHSTTAELSSTKATLGSQTEDTVYVSADTMVSGPSTLHLTADNGVPSGYPCASSTRKREQATVDCSVRVSQGSEYQL